MWLKMPEIEHRALCIQNMHSITKLSLLSGGEVSHEPFVFYEKSKMDSKVYSAFFIVSTST